MPLSWAGVQAGSAILQHLRDLHAKPGITGLERIGHFDGDSRFIIVSNPQVQQYGNGFTGIQQFRGDTGYLLLAIWTPDGNPCDFIHD
jgi:hypothetical protein